MSPSVVAAVQVKHMKRNLWGQGLSYRFLTGAVVFFYIGCSLERVLDASVCQIEERHDFLCLSPIRAHHNINKSTVVVTTVRTCAEQTEGGCLAGNPRGR